MSEAEGNFAYWVQAYAEDLAKNRDPNDFGMRWMHGQIVQWREAVEAERAEHVGSPKQ